MTLAPQIFHAEPYGLLLRRYLSGLLWRIRLMRLPSRWIRWLHGLGLRIRLLRGRRRIGLRIRLLWGLRLIGWLVRLVLRYILTGALRICWRLSGLRRLLIGLLLGLRAGRCSQSERTGHARHRPRRHACGDCQNEYIYTFHFPYLPGC